MKAILRRAGAPNDGAHLIRYGRLEIDEEAREVRVDGKNAKLTPREYALLVTLARNPGVAFSRERLLEKVWGIDYGGESKTVDVHVYRLRKRLERDFSLPQVLYAVHGHGYKFVRP